MRVVASILAVMLFLSGPGVAGKNKQPADWEIRSQYIAFVPAPAPPVSEWGSKLPSNKAEAFECFRATNSRKALALPKRGTTGEVNGKKYVVLGSREKLGCLVRCKKEWCDYTSGEGPYWDAEHTTQSREECKVDYKEMQLRTAKRWKKKADALLEGGRSGARRLGSSGSRA